MTKLVNFSELLEIIKTELKGSVRINNFEVSFEPNEISVLEFTKEIGDYDNYKEVNFINHSDLAFKSLWVKNAQDERGSMVDEVLYYNTYGIDVSEKQHKYITFQNYKEIATMLNLKFDISYQNS